LHFSDFPAVDFIQLGGGGANHFRRALDAHLLFDHRHHSIAVLGSDVNQKHVRYSGRHGAIHLRDHAALNQVHRHGEHNADAQRDEYGLGMRTRPIDIRDAVPRDSG